MGGQRKQAHSSCAVRRWAVALVAALCAVTMMPALAQPAAAESTRKVSAWIPYWDQTHALSSFLANADLYDEALPFWYEMHSPMSITPYWQAEDPTVIAAIRAAGVRLLPTISNAFDGTRVTNMVRTRARRSAHVKALVNLVTTKGYDGLDVDYENMLATDRTHFTSFIVQLAKALHAKGKVLDVAVASKTAEPGDWGGARSEDYAAIGRV